MWRTVKIGDLLEVQNGYAFNSKQFDAEGDIPLIRIRDLKNAVNTETRYAGDYDEKYVVEKGDLLIGMDGEFRCYEWQGKLALLNQRVCRLQNFHADLNRRFLLYAINDELKKIEDMTGFTTVKHLSSKTIKEIELSLPPLAEQQRIVAKLDAAFAEIDRAVEIATEKQQQCEQLADTALDEIANLNGESVTLSQVCSIEAALVSPTEVPYRHQKHIGAGNIVSFSNQLVDVMTAEEEKLTSGKYPFNESSVLYSKIRPYLRKVHLPGFEGICSADMYPLIPDMGKTTREFLFYLLLSNHFTNYAIAGSARAGMPKVNRNHLFAYQFSLPSVTTQNTFAEKMAQILTQTRNLNAVYQSQINELTVLKSAILAQELQQPQSEAA